MTPSEYQDASRNTALHPYDSGDKFAALNQAVLETVGEAGEVADVWKKALRNNDPIVVPRERLIDEAGDVLWGLARLFDALDATFEEAMQYNIDKLARRHGGTGAKS